MFSSGSASLNARMNGMIAVRTLVYFILTSLLNAILGVILVLLIHPGNPGLKESIAPPTHARAVNILDSLLDLGRYDHFLGQIGFISIYILNLNQKHETSWLLDYWCTKNTELGTKAQIPFFIGSKKCESRQRLTLNSKHNNCAQYNPNIERIFIKMYLSQK